MKELKQIQLLLLIQGNQGSDIGGTEIRIRLVDDFLKISRWNFVRVDVEREDLES